MTELSSGALEWIVFSLLMGGDPVAQWIKLCFLSFFFEILCFLCCFFLLFSKKIKYRIGGWGVSMAGVWPIRVFLGFFDFFNLTKPYI